MSFRVPEHYRIVKGSFASTAVIGNNGAFMIPALNTNYGDLLVVASDQGGWDHVSVSYPKKMDRIPSWSEMCRIKDLFWDETDCVVQYHPPKDQFVNNHPGCLHMWRCTTEIMPTPPAWMVGIKELGTLDAQYSKNRFDL